MAPRLLVSYNNELMPISPSHIPVLPVEVADLLDPQPGQTMVDCTLGLGGHAAILLPKLGPHGTYLGLDLDPANLARAKDRLAPIADAAQVRLLTAHANFRDLPDILAAHNIPAVDILLADLGFASSQIKDPDRGLSFSSPGPLDMRLDPTATTTAADLVNNLPQNELADLIYHFGEEPLSRKIARKIVEARRQSPIQSTRQLADLVRRAYGNRARQSRTDPATRTFMALRIAVNAELDALDELLLVTGNLLNPGGRAGIISFHSLEDRRVKKQFVSLAGSGKFQRITRKPVIAQPAEIQANPRSRSAKFRVIRRIEQAD